MNKNNSIEVCMTRPAKVGNTCELRVCADLVGGFERNTGLGSRCFKNYSKRYRSRGKRGAKWLLRHQIKTIHVWGYITVYRKTIWNLVPFGDKIENCCRECFTLHGSTFYRRIYMAQSQTHGLHQGIISLFEKKSSEIRIESIDPVILTNLFCLEFEH